MTGMLASVADLSEAHIVTAAGADIVDLKNPAAGALGALSPAIVRAVVADLNGAVAVSATVGDLALDDPAAIVNAVAVMAATGVDYVKLGWFAGARQADCLAALQPLCAAGLRLVIVMFADRQPDIAWLARFRAAGCAGVMLDTAAKSSGGLRDHLHPGALADFVRRARGLDLLTGLAGSLVAADVAPLLALQPDYLGFRGALCAQGQRIQALDPAAVMRIRALIPRVVRPASAMPA